LADKVVDSLDRYLAEYGVERVREA
jgi:hypothetical protein